MSKIVQAECKAKARFQALLRRSRSSRRSLKERAHDKAQNTIADSQTKFFNFASEPLGSCLQPLSFSSFLLQLICFVIEL